MKKIISLILVIALVVIGVYRFDGMKPALAESVEFKTLNDPALLEYVEESVYKSVIAELDSDEYFVENVSVKYISK